MNKGLEGLSTEELWTLYWKGRGEALRDRLLESYFHLVKYVASLVAARLPNHVKIEDLVAPGAQGLLRAVERFQPGKGARFESYASLLIRGAIVDELRSLDWVPRSVHQRAGKVEEVQRVLRGRLGRDPEEEEIAGELGVGVEEYRQLLVQIRPAIVLPLNSSFGDDDEALTLAEVLADERAQTGYERAALRERAELLGRALKGLTAQERKVLKLRYFEGRMLKEIGRKMGIGESRVSQIHTRALSRLRELLTELKVEG